MLPQTSEGGIAELYVRHRIAHGLSSRNSSAPHWRSSNCEACIT